jgi:formate dehydrogenase subunit gamma
MSNAQQEYENIALSMATLEGALLPVLHKVQRQFGHIPKDAVPIIARVLNLSRAEVHGVVTFYRDFRLEAAGQKRVQVCRAEACRAVGGDALAEHAQSTLGLAFEETSEDGQVSLEAVYCLGLCACAPAIRIDEDLHGRVSALMFDELVKT